MSDHYPHPKKGRNRLIAVVISSLLPVVLCGLGLWFGILMSQDDGAGVPQSIYVIAVAVVVNLGIAAWIVLELFQQKKWARTTWVIMCCIWGGVFMILLFSTAPIGVGFLLVILFILALVYFGLAFYLYRNYHVDVYFRKGDEGLVKKIEEIGEE